MQKLWGFKFLLVDDLESTWEPDAKMVDNLKVNMYLDPLLPTHHLNKVVGWRELTESCLFTP